MSRKMDFEGKYNAKGAGPFHQKNEMFKRVRWDQELKQMGRAFYGVIQPKD
ncbi:MAG: hypothetical protein JRG79_12185, partial [Deltaproteobacteria bacterium]|nr:hypothetical protein [Deltaproteobacteria bacterium]